MRYERNQIYMDKIDVFLIFTFGFFYSAKKLKDSNLNKLFQKLSRYLQELTRFKFSAESQKKFVELIKKIAFLIHKIAFYLIAKTELQTFELQFNLLLNQIIHGRWNFDMFLYFLIRIQFMLKLLRSLLIQIAKNASIRLLERFAAFIVYRLIFKYKIPVGIIDLLLLLIILLRKLRKLRRQGRKVEADRVLEFILEILSQFFLSRSILQQYMLGFQKYSVQSNSHNSGVLFSAQHTRMLKTKTNLVLSNTVDMTKVNYLFNALGIPVLKMDVCKPLKQSIVSTFIVLNPDIQIDFYVFEFLELQRIPVKN